MQSPVEITFRDIESTEAIESRIKDKVSKCEQHCPRIVSCHVVIEQVKKHQGQGKLYACHITVNVPGDVFVINKHRDPDVYVVIRDSFQSMLRLLDGYHQKTGGEEKLHPVEMGGVIDRLYGEDGYGFIKDSSGQEFYFHGNNLHNFDFPSLQECMRVNFIEAMGDEGPQAHRVTVTKS